MMNRRLLPLFAVLTLAACRPDTSGNEGTPSDTTAAQRTATAAVWDLPWYYLAAPVCLVARMGDEHEQLIDDLLALSYRDQDQFGRVLLGTTTSQDTSLIRRIRSIVVAQATDYKWPEALPWPNGLKVRIRQRTGANPVLRQEIVLGPTALHLPWPFPNDSLTGFRLRDRAEALGIKIQKLALPEPDQSLPDGYFYLDRLVNEADSVIVHHQEEIGDPSDEAQVRAAVLNRVKQREGYQDVPFPAQSIRITVDTDVATDATRVLYEPDGPAEIHLELGWDPIVKRVEPELVDWPCAALK
jgi:hypothetical protein